MRRLHCGQVCLLMGMSKTAKCILVVRARLGRVRAAGEQELPGPGGWQGDGPRARAPLLDAALPGAFLCAILPIAGPAPDPVGRAPSRWLCAAWNKGRRI